MVNVCLLPERQDKMKTSSGCYLQRFSWKWWLALSALGSIASVTLDLAVCSAFQKSSRMLPSCKRPHLLSYRNSIWAATKSSFGSSASPAIRKQLFPLLDFRRNGTIDLIDRLDDAIMGGISTSYVRQGTSFAIWSGVCRTDGGGFCGFRTNTFRNPLLLNDTLFQMASDGFYLRCRLVSDNEADRRVWKLTTRTKPDRGELLYQAPIRLTEAANQYSKPVERNLSDWVTVYAPFDSFRLVRGPRIIENGPFLNISKGIYQIGMSMSQFLFAASSNSTEKTLSNFRDGYFELHIEEIGVYVNSDPSSRNDVSHFKANSMLTTTLLNSQLQDCSLPLNVYSKPEMKEQQPTLLKFLILISKIFFSERR